MDLKNRDNLILAGKPIEHARALARAMWDAELEAQQTMAVRSSAIRKIKRHLKRKAKADLPKLTPGEHSAFVKDVAHLEELFPSLGLGDLPLRDRAACWAKLRDTGRGKRGVGPKEVRPGIMVPGFSLLDWRKENGFPITATLEGVAQEKGIAWGEEEDRLYSPSETVEWLAGELCLLAPSLASPGAGGRRPDWDLAYRIAQRWREWRGLTKGSR